MTKQIETGTHKQIEWATKIKAEMIDRLTVTVQDMGSKRARAGKSNNADAVLAVLLPILDAKTDADWWIDNRSAVAAQLAISIATTDDKAKIQALN